MKMPELESPEKYGGLYVFDFGDQVAVGYTADEIAVLLESQQYADGKVYRIHRAMPDGTMELQGVSRETFLKEDGLFFYRSDPDLAEQDFQALVHEATGVPPPCRMKLHLARISGAGYELCTVAIFPAEYTHDVSNWLNRIGYEGGDLVEGGPSQVTDYYAAGATVIRRQQLWPTFSQSRPAEEVLATTHLAVQRKMA
ncbi:MAG: hypothetical protein QUV05_19095 [Phycisphaerae bacterium]|nr:hypothetical protein [Phycisphaerae bacterium]